MWQEIVGSGVATHGGKQLDLEIRVLMTILLVLIIGPIFGVNDLEGPK